MDPRKVMVIVSAINERRSLQAKRKMHAKNIVADSILLAQQTPEWVAKHADIYPKLNDYWRRAVRRQLATLGRYVIIGIAEAAPKLSMRRVRQPTLNVLQDNVLISCCPLCQQELVPISPVSKEQFFAATVRENGELLPPKCCARECEHRLYLPPAAWNIIRNARMIIDPQESVGEAEEINPKPLFTM